MYGYLANAGVDVLKNELRLLLFAVMAEPNANILILRGAPAVGKSTVARDLRAHLPNGFLIEVDALRGMWHGVTWLDGPEHLCALNAVAQVAQTYTKQGWTPGVIVDWLDSHHLAYLLQELDKVDLRPQVCTLLASVNTYQEHMLRRRKDGVRDWNVAWAMDQQIRSETPLANEWRLNVDGLPKNAIPQTLVDWCKLF